MKLTKLKKIVIAIFILMILIVGGSFIYLKQHTYSASDTALKANQSATHEKHYDLFSTSKDNDTAIIFYPGALVDKESYSIWASELAKKGYDVYVMDFPLDLAVLSPNVGEYALDKIKDQRVIMAGHSLGGVMASRFAVKHADKVEGMIFLASYPDKKGNLMEDDIPTLSITAQNDEVLNQQSYQNATQFLPDNITYAVISGGNHSGFGSYGQQKNDGTATISNQKQQDEISKLIDEWIQSM